MKPIARVLCVLVALAATSCGGLGKRHSSGLPSDQVAEVRGVNDGFKILGTELHLSFKGVEGKDLDEGFVDIIELPPGRHSLRCHYLLFADGQPVVADTKDFDIDVEAGRVYQAALVHEKDAGWRVKFSAVTPDDSAKDKAKSAEGAPDGKDSKAST